MPRQPSGIIIAGRASAAVALAVLVAGWGAASDRTPGRPAQPAATGSANAGSAVPGTVWVANEGGGSPSVIDAATNTVVTTVEGIDEPHNVQADERAGPAQPAQRGAAVCDDPDQVRDSRSAAVGYTSPNCTTSVQVINPKTAAQTIAPAIARRATVPARPDPAGGPATSG